MHFPQIRWCVGLLLCLTGVCLLVWGAWPAGKRFSDLIIQPHEMQLPPSGQAFTDGQENASQKLKGATAILETRRLVLETPNFSRPGDPAEVRLEFNIDSAHDNDGQNRRFANLYETHHISAEARLEVGGLQVEPPGTLIRTLAPGQSVNFNWILWPEQGQTYEGTAWFYLRYMPKDGGSSSSWPLAALRVELSPVSLLGLSGPLTRRLGGMGVLVGLLLLADLLIRRLSLRLKVISSEAAR